MPRTIEQIPDPTREARLPSGEQTLRDLGRLHSGSAVKWKGKMYMCKEGAVYCRQENKIYMAVHIDGGRTRFIPFDEIDNDFPETGYYNIASGTRKAIMINRRTASRSWRYGFHKAVADVSMPYMTSDNNLMHEVLKDVPRVLGMNFENVYRYYFASKGKFHPFSVALRSIKKGKSLSVAINRQVAIASSPYENEIGVFLMGSKVGVVNSSEEVEMLVDWAEDSVLEVCNG